MQPHQPFFIHGDRDKKSGLYFCRRCDAFVEPDHFSEPAHRQENEARVQEGVVNVRRRSANQPEAAQRDPESENLLTPELSDAVRRRLHFSTPFLPWVMKNTDSEDIRTTIQEAFESREQTPRYDDILELLDASDQKAFEALYNAYLRR